MTLVRYLRVEVTATNIGGSTVAYSTIHGPATATATTSTTPNTSSAQIRSALSAIAHPSGKRAINKLAKTTLFKTEFHAPGRHPIHGHLVNDHYLRYGKAQEAEDRDRCQRFSEREERWHDHCDSLHLTSVGNSLLQ